MSTSFFVLLSTVLALLYEFDVILPLYASLAISVIVVSYTLKRHGLLRMDLSKLYMIVYAMPFIHGFEYVGLDFERDRPGIMWGLATNPYTFVEPIILRVFMLGAIGLLALVAPYYLFKGRERSNRIIFRDCKNLALPSFMILIFIAFSLSWLNTPQESVFVAAYTQSKSLLEGTNFNAAWLLAYVFLAVAFIDTEFFTIVPTQLKIKRVIIYSVTFYIVIVHQFMRGDRECISLIAAYVILFMLKPYIAHRKSIKLMEHKESIRNVKPSRIKFMFIVLFIFITSNVVGTARSMLNNSIYSDQLSEQIQTSLSRIFAGTWSAVLLTPLSIVGDFYFNLKEYKFGQTYIDLLLSAPPGVFARFFNYERPIEGTHGPAWEMRYGIGGTHALVVPFMNFGALGITLMLLIIGYIFYRIDKAISLKPTNTNLILFASLVISAPHWFWYGEMSGMRGFMAFVSGWIIYSGLIWTQNTIVKTYNSKTKLCIA